MITTHTGARSWRNQRGRHRPTAVPGRIPAPPGDRPGVRPTARSEACRSQGLEPRQWRCPGGAGASLAHGLEAVAATWFGEIWSRAHRLGEAGPPWRTPARISSMICGSTCAGCARCPTCCHGRQARAHASRAAQGSGLGHAAAVAGARLGRLHDGSAAAALRCRSGYRSASLGARARAAPRSRTTRCTPTCRPNASRPCCACSGNAARRSAAMAERAPRSLYRALGRRLEVGTRRCARAWITPPTRGRGASMRRGSASNACAMPARRCCCSVHPASSSATSRPWPTCKARWAARRTSVQPPRWGAMCVSLSTGRLAVDKATKRPCDCCAGPAMACAQPAGACCGGRLSGRRPAADGGPTPRPAGAEAPRATA